MNSWVKSPPGWIPQRVELLEKLWMTHSATQLAQLLGCTRNMVIGKVARLNLPCKRPTRKRASKRPVPKKLVKPKIPVISEEERIRQLFAGQKYG